MNTPMTDAAILNQGFDFDLRFLDNYVQTHLAQGKKIYDQSKRQVLGDLQIEGISAGGLNYKPYQTPGMTRVNANLHESNPLFKQEQAQVNPDENLKVRSQKKMWG